MKKANVVVTPRSTATIDPTSFIGRDQELIDIAALFREARLVTLVGPPGVGKTRLAEIYCARAIDPEPSLFRAIPLEAIAQPEQVLPTIASALGLRDTAQSPHLAARIATQFRGQRVLLLLDNFEHVLDAAPDIRKLIDETPGLSILVTSQATLKIKPEKVLPIDPFEPPSPEDAKVPAKVWGNPAVRLFADRARAVKAIIEPGSVGDVAEIVQRLDGLPLAIELAAAAMWKFRTPALLLSQFDQMLPVLDQGWRDASQRHATMRAAVDWSYQLLDPQEQALFARVSVFAGGFSQELAEKLARGRAAGGPYPHNDGKGTSFWNMPDPADDPYLIGTDVGDYSLAVALPPLDGNVGELLESLADKYLLQRVVGRDGSARFRMLETMRAYGREQLDFRGEGEETRHAHAVAMMAFSEASATSVWTSRHDPLAIPRVDDEIGNLRAAIAWATSSGAAGAEIVVRTVDPIWQYFQFRGMLVDVRYWFESALAFPTVPPVARALGLAWLGLVCWIQGDDIEASRAVDEALVIARQLDLGIIEARALVPPAAAIAWRMGDLASMAQCIERALPLYQERLDGIGIGICLFLQGQLLRMQGESAMARAVLDQSYEFAAMAGYGWGMATARYHAAEAMRDQGDIDESAHLLVEALDLYWDEEDGWGGASVVSSAAVIATHRSDPKLAARLFGIAATLIARAGAFFPPSQLVEYTATEERVRKDLADAFDPAYQAGLALNPRSGVAEVRAYLVGASEVTATLEPPASSTETPTQQFPRLSPQEHKAVALLRKGHNPKEIGQKLGIGYSTAAGHVKSARDKWGASTNAELAAMAERSGHFEHR